MIQNNNFTLLNNTETIFIENIHLDISLEHDRDYNKWVWKPLNLILILFLFQDLPIEGVFLKEVYNNRQGHKSEELVNNPCAWKGCWIKKCSFGNDFNPLCAIVASDGWKCVEFTTAA